MNLITTMIVRNEADRYLPEVLSEAETYSDKIIVLDDCSTDNTVDVCEDHGATVYQHDEGRSIFWEKEHALREYLWKQILPREAHTGDWILTLDADEIMADQFKLSLPKLMLQDNINTYTMRFWESWGEKYKVRVDGTWNPLGKETPLMTRFLPQVNYRFPRIGLHCGRLPMNIATPVVPSGCGVLHLGWANPEEHEEKIKRYTENDPNPHPQMMQHYKSMREEPTLIDWFL